MPWQPAGPGEPRSGRTGEPELDASPESVEAPLLVSPLLLDSPASPDAELLALVLEPDNTPVSGWVPPENEEEASPSRAHAVAPSWQQQGGCGRT